MVNSVPGPPGLVSLMVALSFWRYVMVRLEVNRDKHFAGSWGVWLWKLDPCLE